MGNTELQILIYHPVQGEADAYADIIRGQGFSAVKTAFCREEAERELPGTEVILAWKFPVDLLHEPAAESVRWFQSMGAGVDDLAVEGAIPATIELTRVVGQYGGYISEYVFAYLLSIAKNLPRMSKAQEEKRWEPFMAGTLEGKVIGVAGLGSIGEEVVRKARSFDMKVHGLSMSGKKKEIVDVHFGQDQWAEFVEGLDYLVLTLPLTKETRHIIDRKTLLKMKEDACLVNVGRGALIVESDLAEVMADGHLQAAVLDVFEQEPLPDDHPFWTLPNVHVTPHISGPSTAEGVGRYFANNLKRYTEGRPLNGVVDRKQGY